MLGYLPSDSTTNENVTGTTERFEIVTSRTVGVPVFIKKTT